MAQIYRAMKLADFLKQRDITAQTFAERIGRYPSTVTRLLSGKHTPDAATMKAIIEATEGLVTPNDFFELPEGGAPQAEAVAP